jgi:ATP phosphoribosyltransferase
MTAWSYWICAFRLTKVGCCNVLRGWQLTPGKRSPTISSLDDSGFCAVSALVAKDEAASIMDKLAAVGADSILIFAIANSRM